MGTGGVPIKEKSAVSRFEVAAFAGTTNFLRIVAGKIRSLQFRGSRLRGNDGLSPNHSAIALLLENIAILLVLRDIIGRNGNRSAGRTATNVGLAAFVSTESALWVGSRADLLAIAAVL